MKITISNQSDASDTHEVDWPPSWRVPAQGEVLHIGTRVFEVANVEWRVDEAQLVWRVLLWGSWESEGPTGA